MLKFLLGILALLAMGINAATIPSSNVTSVNFPNHRNGSDPLPMASDVFVPCDFPANEEFASHCYCWAAKDDIHAVDRVWISTAIDRACETYFTGGVGKPFLRLVAQLCTSADTFAGDPVSVYGTAPGLTPCQAHHP